MGIDQPGHRLKDTEPLNGPEDLGPQVKAFCALLARILKRCSCRAHCEVEDALSEERTREVSEDEQGKVEN